jgi:hypothetical protein
MSQENSEEWESASGASVQEYALISGHIFQMQSVKNTIDKDANATSAVTKETRMLALLETLQDLEHKGKSKPRFQREVKRKWMAMRMYRPLSYSRTPTACKPPQEAVELAVLLDNTPQNHEL